MTDNQPIPASVLDEIELLEKAAVRGPWVFNGGDSVPVLHIYSSDDLHVFHGSHPLAEQEAAAKLIALVRNHLPGLIRLARIGMKAEGSGWKLVPVEPTSEMVTDGRVVMWQVEECETVADLGDLFRKQWAQALAAAPETGDPT